MKSEQLKECVRKVKKVIREKRAALGKMSSHEIQVLVYLSRKMSFLTFFLPGVGSVHRPDIAVVLPEAKVHHRMGRFLQRVIFLLFQNLQSSCCLANWHLWQSGQLAAWHFQIVLSSKESQLPPERLRWTGFPEVFIISSQIHTYSSSFSHFITHVYIDMYRVA